MWATSGEAIAGTPPKNWQQLLSQNQALIDTFLGNKAKSETQSSGDSRAGRGGVGCTFGFTIVAEEVPSSPLLFIPPEAKNYLNNKRLLIVDDNLTLLKILSRETQSWGMNVETAASAEEAMSLLINQPLFDLVILDWQMPEKDGITLSSEIHKLPNYATVPIVMMVPLGSKLNNRDQFTACLNKPIKKSLLFNVVSKIFGQQALISPPIEPENLGSQPVTQVASLRILLAEDHLVNQKVALQMLERLGHQTDIANNGLEAIAALKQKTYDVVLMDVQMPEMNGLEAAQKIHEAFLSGELTYRPRIIAMTANAMSGDREACLAAGMDDYISKPIRMVELSQVLSACQPLAATEETISVQPLAPCSPNKAPSPAYPEPIAQRSGQFHIPVEQNLPELREGESLLDANILNSLREIDSLEEIIEVYLTESPKLLHKMTQAMNQGDIDQLRDAAHSLKSTSGAIGANTLAQLSQTLEQMARRGNITEAEALIAKIETEYPLVKAALEQEIQTS